MANTHSFAVTGPTTCLILCAVLSFRFCPRLRDLPDRKLATNEQATAYKDLDTLLGRRVKPT